MSRVTVLCAASAAITGRPLLCLLKYEFSLVSLRSDPQFLLSCLLSGTVNVEIPSLVSA
jgi:hypothetical protein